MKALTPLNRIASATLIGAVCLTFFSCVKKETPAPTEPVVDEPAFSVSIDAIDGIISNGKISSRPSVLLTMNSKDEAANYTIRYHVDANDWVTVSSMWSGKTRDISSAFSEFTTYGSHTLSGFVYPTGKENERVSFEETVWVRYEQITVGDITFASALDNTPFSGARLSLLESGTLDIKYTPVSAGANFSVTSDQESVISFEPAKATMGNGEYSIPYKVSSVVGTASVTVRIENGTDTDIRRTTVTTDAGKVVSIKPTVTAEPVFLSGKPFTAAIDIESPQGNVGDVTFKLEHFIDGKKEREESGIKLPYKGAYTKTLSGMGEHTYSVKLTSDAFTVVDAEASTTFFVASPILTLTDTQTGTTSVMSTTSSTALKAGRKYSIALSGVTDQYMQFVSLSGAPGKDDVTGKNPWTLIPQKTGEGALTLKVSNNNIDYPAKRTDTVKIVFDRGKNATAYIISASMTESYVHSSIKVKATCSYTGVAEYTYADYDHEWYDSDNIIRPDTPKVIDSSVRKNETTTILDLTSENSEYNGTEYQYTTYEDNGYETWAPVNDYATYQLYINSLTIDVYTESGYSFDSFTDVSYTVSGALEEQPSRFRRQNMKTPVIVNIHR